MKNRAFMLAFVVSFSLGCGGGHDAVSPSGKASESQSNASREGPMTSKESAPLRPKPTADSVTLTGTLEGMDRSRGKTMAAWYGVPAGEYYFRFALDGGQDRPPGAKETTMLRVPEAFRREDLVGQKVRVVGTWSKVASRDPANGDVNRRQAPLEAPRQMPIIPAGLPELEAAASDDQKPSEAAPERVEGWVVAPTRPIFTATGVDVL